VSGAILDFMETNELALGVGSIVVGAALVCAGIFFWPQSPRGDDPSGYEDGPKELRPIIDALEEQDRRS
jgi:hypothetical protein